MAVTTPVTLSRSVSCALDNAVRAAGADGRVVVEVPSNTSDIAIRVLDDGPGLGNVPTNNSLGLTITRALVSACGGAFELKPGAESGMVAQIILPTVSSKGMASSETLIVT
jgi:K+-sensing histidine kinase KdpD